ncbi:hypothetical protein LTR08_003131 [Meristemomyces frigidus]|nr:hypothetical protein LTR08_003131 [Meristemomyces frigidus]
MFSLRALALALCVSLATAARLTVSIPASALLPNPATLPPSTHAVLVGPPGVRYDAPIRRDSTFLFPALPAASYLLTLHSRDYAFPPLRIDVSSAPAESPQQQPMHAWQTFRGNEWANKGPSYGAGHGELHVHVQASSPKDFYQSRGGFNLMGFVKSPMILMGIVSAAMIFGMPYVMENMDPETKAEFEEMQSKSPITGSGGAANQIQNFDLAGWMAGKTADTGASAGGGGKKK